MKTMKKRCKRSHFEAVSVCRLETLGNRVVQVWPRKLYTNSAGYAVILVELDDAADTDDMSEGTDETC